MVFEAKTVLPSCAAEREYHKHLLQMVEGLHGGGQEATGR